MVLYYWTSPVAQILEYWLRTVYSFVAFFFSPGLRLFLLSSGAVTASVWYFCCSVALVCKLLQLLELETVDPFLKGTIMSSLCCLVICKQPWCLIWLVCRCLWCYPPWYFGEVLIHVKQKRMYPSSSVRVLEISSSDNLI